MSDFTIDFNGVEVPVTCILENGGVVDISKKNLEEFPAFKTWRTALAENLSLQRESGPDKHAFHDNPFNLKSIKIQSVDWFGPRIGFIKLEAILENEPKDGNAAKILPGISFLRGGSVAMLMILRPKDASGERLVLMTEQARVPAGSLSFLEIPAGMLDHEKKFSGAAAKEIEEETGFKIPHTELIDMTELALRNSERSQKQLKAAMYPSPGGCDEFISIFLWEKELDRLEIEVLKGKLTGNRAGSRAELITLRMCNYEDLWREGARDAKTIAAWALYEGLNRSGDLRQELKRRQELKNRQESRKRPNKSTQDTIPFEEVGRILRSQTALRSQPTLSRTGTM